MKVYIFGILVALLLVQTVYATHSVEYRKPDSIVTTVGQLTTLQIDIKNSGSTQEYYRVTISAVPSNVVEITNPSITTKTLNPSESVSVFSNIRTLTEAPAVLTVQIYRGDDLTDFIVPAPTISVSSKKFSLPEFGLSGMVQIMAIASVLYFSFGSRFRASQR